MRRLKGTQAYTRLKHSDNNQENEIGYEWGKGTATTQARLINPQMNHKGKATKFKEEKPGYLD